MSAEMNYEVETLKGEKLSPAEEVIVDNLNKQNFSHAIDENKDGDKDDMDYLASFDNTLDDDGKISIDELKKSTNSLISGFGKKLKWLRKATNISMGNTQSGKLIPHKEIKEAFDKIGQRINTDKVTIIGKTSYNANKIAIQPSERNFNTVKDETIKLGLPFNEILNNIDTTQFNDGNQFLRLSRALQVFNHAVKLQIITRKNFNNIKLDYTSGANKERGADIQVEEIEPSSEFVNAGGNRSNLKIINRGAQDLLYPSANNLAKIVSRDVNKLTSKPEGSNLTYNDFPEIGDSLKKVDISSYIEKGSNEEGYPRVIEYTKDTQGNIQAGWVDLKENFTGDAIWKTVKLLNNRYQKYENKFSSNATTTKNARDEAIKLYTMIEQVKNSVLNHKIPRDQYEIDHHTYGNGEQKITTKDGIDFPEGVSICIFYWKKK